MWFTTLRYSSIWNVDFWVKIHCEWRQHQLLHLTWGFLRITTVIFDFNSQSIHTMQKMAAFHVCVILLGLSEKGQKEKERLQEGLIDNVCAVWKELFSFPNRCCVCFFLLLTSFHSFQGHYYCVFKLLWINFCFNSTSSPSSAFFCTSSIYTFLLIFLCVCVYMCEFTALNVCFIVVALFSFAV